MIHQESIVIPENIDVIRVMTEIDKHPMVSIDKTSKTMARARIVDGEELNRLTGMTVGCSDVCNDFLVAFLTEAHL